MDKKYAIEILEMVERKMLSHKSSLFTKAYNYLQRLVSTQSDQDLLDRLHSAKYKSQW